MSACGAMGPTIVAFLKEVYGRAKDADKFLMSQQPAFEVLMEHDGGFVFLGHVPEHCMRGNGATRSSKTASSFTTTPPTSTLWRGSPTLTPNYATCTAARSSPLPECE